MSEFIKGTPAEVDDNRLYAVLRRCGDSGPNVGIVARGEDITWSSPMILAHWPMPFEMGHAEAKKLRRDGVWG
jgi:hypothetical protein